MTTTLPRKNGESLTDWTLRFMADALRPNNPVIANHLDRRGKVLNMPCTCADCYQPLGTGPCIACDSCGGTGLVPANSGSDVADFKCGECNGKGVRP